ICLNRETGWLFNGLKLAFPIKATHAWSIGERFLRSGTLYSLHSDGELRVQCRNGAIACCTLNALHQPKRAFGDGGCDGTIPCLADNWRYDPGCHEFCCLADFRFKYDSQRHAHLLDCKNIYRDGRVSGPVRPDHGELPATADN